jgi:uncharacterized protein DUF4265
MPPDEKLTKVHVELPNNPDLGGESMWAVDLGDDLYELRNVAFQAYGLNFGDVVRATSDSPALKPEIRRVEERSGHRTLRVLFAEWCQKKGCSISFSPWHCYLPHSNERATDTLPWTSSLKQMSRRCGPSSPDERRRDLQLSEGAVRWSAHGVRGPQALLRRRAEG